MRVSLRQTLSNGTGDSRSLISTSLQGFLIGEPLPVRRSILERRPLSSIVERHPGGLALLLPSKTERLNTLSALIGAIAATCGVSWLLTTAVRGGDPWKIASFSTYGASLIAVYVFATLYHGSNGRAKAIFSKLDHLSIYLLIAGTYTPFSLVTLRDSVGWEIFFLIWGMAVFGMILDLMPNNGKRVFQVIIYLAMGWLMVVALDPLLRALSIAGFYYLFLGGILYTVGVVFYALDGRVRGFHAVWHLFVIAGSFSHFVSIFGYVA